MSSMSLVKNKYDSLMMAERIQLIKNHPCFSKLTDEELAKIAALTTQKKYPAGAIIVYEEALVDSIYFIVQGVAEVQKHGMLIAKLSVGEAIGLSETGFYSRTGKRTATVIASTDITTMHLDIQAFYQFANKIPHINLEMRASAETLQRMNLIKHAVPFAALTAEDLNWLALRVADITLEAGEKIFQEGDPGKCCYLIQSGKIEIYTNIARSDVRLAVLKSGMIFGETSLLLSAMRNASARALSKCRLLSLSRDDLMYVIQKEQHVARMLSAISKTRSRPTRLAHIEVHPYETDDQETYVTLKDPINHEYYRLSREGLLLWNLSDGSHTLRDLTVAYYKEYGVFNPTIVEEFIAELMTSGFLTHDPMLAQKNADVPRWERFFAKLKLIMKRISRLIMRICG